MDFWDRVRAKYGAFNRTSMELKPGITLGEAFGVTDF